MYFLPSNFTIWNNFLKSFGIKRKERNNNDDAVAASMILETVLNSINKL